MVNSRFPDRFVFPNLQFNQENIALLQGKYVMKVCMKIMRQEIIPLSSFSIKKSI